MIFGPTPHKSPLIIGEGIRILKIKYQKANKWKNISWLVGFFCYTLYGLQVKVLGTESQIWPAGKKY
jgi:hypothetical protein